MLKNYFLPITWLYFQIEEQQAPHETNEQYEERVMNKRANQLYHTIKSKFVQKDTLVFDDLTYRNRRKEVYFLLINKKIISIIILIIIN